MLLETPWLVVPTAVKSDGGRGKCLASREQLVTRGRSGYWFPTWFLKKAPDSALQPLLPCLRKLWPSFILLSKVSLEAKASPPPDSCSRKRVSSRPHPCLEPVGHRVPILLIGKGVTLQWAWKTSACSPESRFGRQSHFC